MIGGPGPRHVRSMLEAGSPRGERADPAEDITGDPAELARAKASARHAYRQRSCLAGRRTRRGMVIAIAIGVGLLLAVTALVILLR